MRRRAEYYVRYQPRYINYTIRMPTKYCYNDGGAAISEHACNHKQIHAHQLTMCAVPAHFCALFLSRSRLRFPQLLIKFMYYGL